VAKCAPMAAAWSFANMLLLFTDGPFVVETPVLVGAI
jgi:hypothetical protein